MFVACNIAPKSFDHSVWMFDVTLVIAYSSPQLVLYVRSTPGRSTTGFHSIYYGVEQESTLRNEKSNTHIRQLTRTVTVWKRTSLGVSHSRCSKCFCPLALAQSRHWLITSSTIMLLQTGPCSNQAPLHSSHRHTLDTLLHHTPDSTAD